MKSAHRPDPALEPLTKGSQPGVIIGRSAPFNTTPSAAAR
jgi:hypothetical protein